MIVGQVTDGTGDPMPGVEVGAGFGESAETDHEGRYRFDRAPLTPDGEPREWPVTARRGFDSQQATVTVRPGEETVQDFRFDAVNTPPEAHDKDVTTTGSEPVAVTLTGFDADGDALAFEVVAGPAHGTLSGTAPELTYVAEDGFSGSDAFTFAVFDGIDRAEATVTVTVTAPEPMPVNQPPQLEVPELVEVVAGETVAAPLSAHDADGDALAITARDLPPFAVLADAGDGTAVLVVAPEPDVGPAEVVVTIVASDGTAEVEAAVRVRVLAAEVEEPPGGPDEEEPPGGPDEEEPPGGPDDEEPPGGPDEEEPPAEPEVPEVPEVPADPADPADPEVPADPADPAVPTVGTVAPSATGPEASTVAAPGTLARTGADLGPRLLLGAVAVAVGVVLQRLSARRRG